MKKKTRATASRAGKRPKSAASGQKAAPRRSSAPGSRPPAVSNGTRATIRRLKAQLARTQAQIEELQASADTDFLLGIPNRRGFERELNRAIAYIKRYRAGGALVVLDVDRLKPINDAFGHAAGDQVLKTIVTTLLAQVRASDVVGRLGGDEFALLLWNLSETDAKAKAAALEEAIDRLTFVFDGRTITAGASAGVSLLDTHSEAGRALEAADSAMYVRKALRRHEANSQSVRWAGALAPCPPSDKRCRRWWARLRFAHPTNLRSARYSPLRSSGTLPNLCSSFASPNSPIMGSPLRLKATAPMLPAIRDIVSARRNAVVGLWHSSAAPATSVPLSSCRNGIAT